MNHLKRSNRKEFEMLSKIEKEIGFTTKYNS